MLDSTNTTEILFKRYSSSQYNPKNKYPQDYKFIDSISTNVYKPFFYCGNCGDNKMSFKNSNKIQDKYYIITNVINGDDLEAMDFSTVWYFIGDSKSNNNSKKVITNVKYWSEIRAKKYNFKVVFELKDEITNEILYYSQNDLNSRYAKFILVSYFIKQKQLFLNEFLITDSNFKTKDLIKKVSKDDLNGNSVKSSKEVVIDYKNNRWLCTDVTILDGEKNISYILKNENDETIAVNNINNWKLEKDIVEQKKLAEAEKEKIKLQREKNILELEKKEKEKKEILKEKMIAKYGKELGLTISNHKVKIGMTKEMCKDSWGIPLWSEKKTTNNRIEEIWYFGLAYSLVFEDDKLSMINE